MRIRTQLNLSSAIAAVILVIMIPMIFWSLMEFRRADDNLAQTVKMQKSINERILLRDQYLFVTHTQGDKSLWYAKTDELEKIIRSLNGGSSEYRETIGHLKKSFEDNQTIYNRIVSVSEQQHDSEKGRGIAREMVQRLSAQLLLKANMLSEYARELVLINQRHATTSRNRIAIILSFFIILLTGVILYNSIKLNSTVKKRLGLLSESAELIAQGHLNHRITIDGTDELCDLSRVFNSMQSKLQSSYGALEDEIEEHKLSEESLVASERTLRKNEEQIEGLNRELRQQIIEMQEANRELESFTYSVSHDLRAPLRHVVGFVEKLLKLEQGNLGEKSAHYLDVIASSARKMGTLIDDLLSFSRMGRTEMMQAQVKLDQLARDIVEEIRAGLPEGVAISWTILPLPEIMGDKSMLRQALLNLLSNAAKFSQHVSAPMIEIGCSETNATENVYFVKDNGVGFDMHYADKLFGLFQRLHSTEEFEGTGVGLANVRRIINRHGGRIWAESRLNEGATFFFALPNIQKEDADYDH